MQTIALVSVAVLIAVASVLDPRAMEITQFASESIPKGNRIELFIGAFVGAITFSGSVIAFLKLSGKFRSAPIIFPAQHFLNLVLGLAMVGFGVLFFMDQSWMAFMVMLGFAFLLGFLLIIPIGGADMPVIVSMLNSYSGWAAAGIGFSLNNPMLIISGSLVGASGAISGMMGAAARYGFRRVGHGRKSEFAGPVLPIGLTLTLKPVLTFVGVWFLINIVTGLYSTGGADISGIAWEAHIGGFVAGFFGIALLDKPRSYDAVIRRRS